MEIIYVLETIFILVEIYVVFVIYIHSIYRYKKMMERCNNNNEVTNNEVSDSEVTDNDLMDKELIIKNFSQPIIKSNMTEEIDVNQIEEDLNLPVLEFRVNSRTVNMIKLNQETTFIGRSRSDDIEINEPTISRSQCFITKEESEYFINIDILRKPILLNGYKIQEDKVQLFNGDVVSMGNGKISFIFIMPSDIVTPLRA